MEDRDAEEVGRGDLDSDPDADTERLGRWDRVGVVDLCDELLTLGSTEGDFETADDLLPEDDAKGVGDADANEDGVEATDSDGGCTVCVAAIETLEIADCDNDPTDVPLPDEEARSVADTREEVDGDTDAQNEGVGDDDKEAVTEGIAAEEAVASTV